MRISRASLLILIAISVPILVELRTVLSFFGIELPAIVTLVIGAIVIGGLVFWATLPAPENSEPGSG